MCEPVQQIQQIFTFKHCTNTERIFCFNIPNKCPICDQVIRADDNETLNNIVKEFQTLPNPLKAANNSKFALAIRPTKGDFLR